MQPLLYIFFIYADVQMKSYKSITHVNLWTVNLIIDEKMPF